MARPPELDNLLKVDGYLYDFQTEICRRYGVFSEYKKRIEECGGIDRFTQGYKEYGLLVQPDNSVVYGWNHETHKYSREPFGKWRLVVPPNPDGSCAIPHGSIVKARSLIAVTKDGNTMDKLSPWAPYVTRPKETVVYHQFQHPRPKRPESLRIYEAHVGISSWEGKINTYRAFADDVIPRIVKQGYNTIHRSGPPDDVKYLVDKAHSYGLTILLDVVHSHASKNVADGLNQWDGTDGGYFHSGARGTHSLWDSRLFDYTQ
ncbi:unnamed protein product [Nippostrongylus brasiliensis]|uniref:1,4-alpha-glucan branching enzyme n=1 Tax=Nippostrongylus brasiliensis TaxID=27835 RepID=A0A0N4XHA1_NIPBR|nr:unnamed protein product [Nippostrongylus brasiliensis]